MQTAVKNKTLTVNTNKAAKIKKNKKRTHTKVDSKHEHIKYKLTVSTNKGKKTQNAVKKYIKY